MLLSPFLAAIQLVAALQSPASQSPAAPVVYNGRDGQLTVHAPKGTAAPVIDGRLDEAAWQDAALLTGFSLYQPIDQRPAPDSTEVLVWYSADAIHFGIRAFEPHGAVRATLADRDRISTDDNVEIHLDTYNERRRAFVFIVNPLGVQADGTKNESGGFIPGSNVAPGQNDLSADFAWESKGRVTEWGYEVEVRIPFSSLRYGAAAEQRWGLQIDRRVQHSGYEETWTPVRKASSSFISQAGWLTGLTGLRHGQVVQLNPELTNTVNGTSCCAPDQRDWRYDADPQLGGNVRWGMGSNFVLNGTVKPDFSQVEADAAQIAADARFALFYPEKRPFFVEGAEQFNVPNSLVYTRRIVRPDAAAKFTGKIARTDIALFSALDDPNTTATHARPLVDIVRLRRDFAQQSTAGMLYSERVGGGRENRVGGGDVKFVFGRMYYAQFQAVASVTRESGTTRTGPMFDAVVDRTGRSFGFHYGVLGIHQDFRADNGFVPRTGFVQPSIANRYTWYGHQGSLLERYLVFIQTSGLWRYDDFFASKSVLENRASLRNELTFHGAWQATFTPTLASYAFDPSAYGGVRTGTVASPLPFVPSGRIPTFVMGMTISTPQFRRFAAAVGMNAGNDVDFFETSRVRRFDYNASLDFRPTSRLRVNTTYVTTSFTRRRDDEQTLSTRIPRLKVEYQVARPIFVRVVAQYEATTRAALRDPRTGDVLLVSANGGFQPSTARTANGLRADWLFSYRPTPGTVFFAGYGSSLTEPDPLAFDRLRRIGDAFFVKASYLLRAR